MASVPLMVWVPVKALFAASCGTLVVSRFSRYRLKQFLATDPGRALVGRALVLSKELGSSISRLQTLDSLSFHLVQISPVTSYLVPALLHRERGARGTHERARCCPRSARYHDGVRAGRRPPVADATGAITSASHLKRNPGEEQASSMGGYFALALREKFAFRGYPLRRLESAGGTWGALLLIAVVFTLEHTAGGWSWSRPRSTGGGPSLRNGSSLDTRYCRSSGHPHCLQFRSVVYGSEGDCRPLETSRRCRVRPSGRYTELRRLLGRHAPCRLGLLAMA